MADDSKLIEFSKAQDAKQADMRRAYERVLFDKVLGCYTVVEKLGLKPIEINDISKSGLSFTLASHDGIYSVKEEVDMRLYFSNDTYLQAKMQVIRVKKIKKTFHTEWEYGCQFDNQLKSYKAIEKFVDFIQTYSQFAKKDDGDHNILYF